MGDYTELENKIIDFMKKADLSESSIKTYMGNFRKLNGKLQIKNLNFIKNPDDVLEKLSGLQNTTIRNYMIAICTILKHFPDKKKLYNKYYEILKRMNKKFEDDAKKNEMTDKQKENFIEWDDVKEIYEELKKKVGDIKNVTKEKYNTILDFVILSLYVLIPPRRNKDWLEMKIVKDKKDADDVKFNYFVLDDKKFIFNNYKTAKTEKGHVMDVPDDLFDVLKYYLKHRPHDNEFLLVNYNGDRINNVNGITIRLNKIFGKKISSSMLRHIYLTFKYGDTLNNMKEDSKNMSHSIEMQKQYIKNN